MRESGFAPYEAIKAATRDAAASLGNLDEWGIIALGMRADLILADANPRDSAAIAAKRTGVMVQSRWLPESELIDKLEACVMKYEKK